MLKYNKCMMLLWEHISFLNIVCLIKTTIEGKLSKKLVSHLIYKNQHDWKYFGSNIGIRVGIGDYFK